MEQSDAILVVGCLLEAQEDVAESDMLWISVGNLLEELHTGDAHDDCGGWIYARSISSLTLYLVGTEERSRSPGGL